MKAKGTFSVTSNPLDSFENGSDGVSLNRMSLEKIFSGDLEATSRGSMLTAMTPVKGSAGYVAIEQVKGKLSGKKGSFVLQHYGVMSAGDERLILEVVPDSGTGDLIGLSGKMEIINRDGEHSYNFDYDFDN